MPDDPVTTTTEPTTTEPTDKDKNFEAIRQKNEALETEVKELRPLRHEKTVREAGFDPTSGEGKSLVRDLGAGLVEAEDGKELSTTLAGYAEEEYGWKPKTALTEKELAAVDGSTRLSDLSLSTSSDNPADIDTEYAAKISEARNQDPPNFSEAARLEREWLRKRPKAG